MEVNINNVPTYLQYDERETFDDLHEQIYLSQRMLQLKFQKIPRRLAHLARLLSHRLRLRIPARDLAYLPSPPGLLPHLVQYHRHHHHPHRQTHPDARPPGPKLRSFAINAAGFHTPVFWTV